MIALEIGQQSLKAKCIVDDQLVHIKILYRPIADLVRNSLEKQQESKRLLNQAKARVEKLIEEAAS